MPQAESDSPFNGQQNPLILRQAPRPARRLRGNIDALKLKQEADQRLAAAQAATAQVRLASPLDGVAARINVQPGQSVDLNTIVAEIVNLKRLLVTVNIQADEAARVRPGQSAEIFIDNRKDAATTGAASFVSPTIDMKTAAASVS